MNSAKFIFEKETEWEKAGMRMHLVKTAGKDYD